MSEQSEAFNAPAPFRLERLVLSLSKTVALHARYHFSVMLPLPESQQREACQLGDQRFRVLAEQAPRCVPVGWLLMQETIYCLYADNTFEFELPADEAMTTASEVGTDLQVEQIQKLSWSRRRGGW